MSHGATTIWERWDGWTPEKGFQDKGMNSFNHYAYGAVGAWMYRTVAGIDLDPDEAGYCGVIFRPRPGGTITWAEAGLETSHGSAAIHWERTRDELVVKLTVPPGSKGRFQPPQGIDFNGEDLPPGHHVLRFQIV